MFDIPAQRFAWIGDDGPGALRQPLGVDTDAQGNVYVADAAARRVVVFDASGKFLREVAGKDMFVRPNGVGGERRGHAALRGRHRRRDRVRRDPPGAGLRAAVGAPPAGHRQARQRARRVQPADRRRGGAPTAASSSSTRGNFRVQVFDGEGKFLRFFGALGRRGGQFARPKELALDAARNVYIVDAAFGNFQIFDSEGRLLLDVGSRGATDEPAKYLLPSGIAVDEDGRVYVVDQFFRKVDVYRPASLQANTGFAVAGSNAAQGAASGPKPPGAAKPAP